MIGSDSYPKSVDCFARDVGLIVEYGFMVGGIIVGNLTIPRNGSTQIKQKNKLFFKYLWAWPNKSYGYRIDDGLGLNKFN